MKACNPMDFKANIHENLIYKIFWSLLFNKFLINYNYYQKNSINQKIFNILNIATYN